MKLARLNSRRIVSMAIAAGAGAALLYLLVALGVIPSSGGAGHETSERGEEGHAKSGEKEHAAQGRIVRLSPKTDAVAKIRVAPARREPLSGSLEATAIVKPDENRVAHISPRISGRIVAVMGRLGKQVKKGEALVRLDSVELGMAKGEYLKRKATLASAREKVEREEALYARQNRLEVGLAGIDLLQARDLLEVARRNFERERSLYKKGSSSEKEMLQAKAALQVARARFRAARKKLVLFGLRPAELEKLSWAARKTLKGTGTTSQRQKLNARIAYLAARAELAAVRERLLTLGLSSREIRALSGRRRGRVSHFVLRAPFAGPIIEKHASLGEVVRPGRRLFTIADLRRVWIILDVYEKDIPRVRVGQRALVAVEGLEETFAGAVTYVSYVVDEKTRTAKVRVDVANPDGKLKPGMFARARIVDKGHSKLATVVPASALQRIGSERSVFVEVGPGRYERREVQVGERFGGKLEIRKGLRAGERVVVGGTFWLKSEVLRSQLGGDD